MSSIYSWSVTAASNANADSGINFAEDQAPSTLNNSSRQVMGRNAEFIADIGGTITAGGTANALTMTAKSAFTSYANGRMVAFIAASDNTGAVTLSVNSIGAKAIRKMTTDGEADLDAGDLVASWVYFVRYSTAANSGAGAWLVDWAPQPAARIDYVPVGSVTDFAGSTAPTGWLMCYGQAVSRTTYADLFTAIGTAFGTGDGSTTFNLPDARGRTIAGKDDMGGTAASRLSTSITGTTLGASGGEETHTLTSGEMPSHTHTGTTSSNGSHNHGQAYRRDPAVSGRYGDFDTGTGSFRPDLTGTGLGNQPATSTAPNHTHTFTTNSAGSGGDHNNVQPTLVLNKIIFAGV